MKNVLNDILPASWLLYRYSELEDLCTKLVEETGTNNQPIEWIIYQLEVNISDNKRAIRELEIHIKNEKVEDGFVSMNLHKQNNLKSINEKAECFIKFLETLNSKTVLKRDDKFDKSLASAFLRRPVAFCICLLYKSNKYDITTMTIQSLKKFIDDNFKNEKTGEPLSSSQKVVRT
jgi:hypothetical protein